LGGKNSKAEHVSVGSARWMKKVGTAIATLVMTEFKWKLKGKSLGGDGVR
jgi:hypothetical protein